MRYLSRILYGFAIFIICVTAALLLQIDSSAMSMADADAIVEAAQRNHVKVCACHQNR